MILKSELNMQVDDSNVMKLCYDSLVTIIKLRYTLPRKTDVHLIQALVFPLVTYCLPAWAPSTRQQSHRYRPCIARIATIRNPDMSTFRLPELALGWLPFEATNVYRDIVLMYSIIHQVQGPQRLKNIVAYRAGVSERATRSTAAGQL